MFKKIALSLCFTLFLGLLTACGPDGGLRLKSKESSEKNQASTQTENTDEAKKDAQETPPSISGIGAPVALPPSFETPENGEGNNGADKSAFLPNGLPALQPMKGVNVDELFSENIKNSDERFDRLEKAVVDMRREFESVKPSIVRLAAVESDIQSLVKEMEVMLQETPASQTASSSFEPEEATLQVEQLNPQPTEPEQLPEDQALQTPHVPSDTTNAGSSNDTPAVSEAHEKPQPLLNKHEEEKPVNAEHILKVPPHYADNKQSLEKPAAKPAPKISEPAPQSYDGTVTQNMRIGEYDDKIRVVLDTNLKTPFTIELDNDEKLIVIELPDAKWIGPKSKKFADSPLLDSYNIEETNGGKGTMIVLSLKRGTSIIKESTLLPDENPSHRIYFDLKR